LRLVHRLYRLETLAAAHGRYHEVQAGVLGVAALFDEVRWGLVLGPDLDELGGVQVRFTEVGTKAALTVMNAEHEILLDWVVSLTTIAPRVPPRQGKSRMRMSFKQRW
jgi:hypothetical protein